MLMMIWRRVIIPVFSFWFHILDRPVFRKRFNLIELHEQPWWPSFSRVLIQDMLAQFWRTRLPLVTPPCSGAIAIVPTLATVLTCSGSTRIIDVASGAGGPFPSAAQELSNRARIESITLTDLFPNIDAKQRIELALPNGLVRYHAFPVDATNCDLPGLRTLFGSLHHFSPALIERMLADAVRRGEGFAAFEPTKRSPLALFLFSCGLFPLGFLLPLFFFRRLSFLQIFTTWIIPINPFVLWFDGIVSCLRTYSAGEFLQIARRADPEETFEWTVSAASIDPFGIHAIGTYVGIPKSKSQSYK